MKSFNVWCAALLQVPILNIFVVLLMPVIYVGYYVLYAIVWIVSYFMNRKHMGE